MKAENRRRKNENRKPAKGFTLLEIMIALAIMGSTLIVILHTVNRHVDISYGNNITTQMYQFAKENIATMKPSVGKSKGIDKESGLYYENLVIKTDDPSIVELQTYVRGHGKTIVLREFVTRNAR